MSPAPLYVDGKPLRIGRRIGKGGEGEVYLLDEDPARVAGLVVGGAGNVDDNILEWPGGAYQAVTLRAFNRASRTWAIWWLDGRQPHQLDVPVIGSFADGVGAFYADDRLNGLPIRVRFLWTETQAGRPRWEQAFSDDAGASWETNWVMRFTRLGARE